jgi:hypothetical protein
MRVNLSDKIIAYLALISGLTISAVAIWYSVAGLVSIFAAAVIPIIVMGVALEISKLIATVWLKINWTRAPIFIRTYLLVAIAILMVITSMGIFGFLSKAHSDQSLVSGDVQAKIAVYDDKIKTSKDNIDANRKALKQMDEAVDQVMGRSSDEKGADKAVGLRRSQQKERVRLQSEIATEQKTIAAISEERAPIAAEVRKVEAEVGPIKYIAAFIYGDNPDANILEKAVTWVIIIIVSVFDPLAVILLLASQYSFQWFRKAEEEEEALAPVPAYEPDDGPLTEDQVEQIEETVERDLVAEGNAAIAEIEHEVPEVELPLEDKFDEKKPIEEWNEMIAEAEKAVEEEIETADAEILDSALGEEKIAMAKWKAEHPDASLKHQRKLFDKGVIDSLPWEKYMLAAEPDFITDNEAAIEAAKWAAEQVAMNKTNKPETYMERVDGEQVKKTIEGYQQNAEQNESTLWKRVQDKKGNE